MKMEDAKNLEYVDYKRWLQTKIKELNFLRDRIEMKLIKYETELDNYETNQKEKIKLGQ